MPHDRARRALQTLHWSARDMARALTIREDTALKWLAGRAPMPPAILDWLERLAAFHDANPPPRPPSRHAAP